MAGLLDISSFFMGVIINLLLITLMCYFFKKKYENIEEAQSEQAKILLDLMKFKKNFENTKVIETPIVNLHNEVVGSEHEDKTDSEQDDSVQDDSEQDEEHDEEHDEELDDEELDEEEHDEEQDEELDEEVHQVVEEVVEEVVKELVEEEDREPDNETMEESKIINVDDDIVLDESDILVNKLDNLETNSVEELNKLNVKVLRDYLHKNGTKVNNRMKKYELINLIKGINNEEHTESLIMNEDNIQLLNNISLE